MVMWFAWVEQFMSYENMYWESDTRKIIYIMLLLTIHINPDTWSYQDIPFKSRKCKAIYNPGYSFPNKNVWGIIVPNYAHTYILIFLIMLIHILLFLIMLIHIGYVTLWHCSHASQVMCPLWSHMASTHQSAARYQVIWYHYCCQTLGVPSNFVTYIYLAQVTH